MMVVGAFNQVQSSLRWFVDNLAQIADWRATLVRIVAFRDTLPEVDTLGEEAGRIAVLDAGSDQLVLEGLAVALPDACATLDQDRVEIAPGERIQIVGTPGAGKSTVFRALAGMWPWGGGIIRLPPRDEMMFMPQRPYLPLGTLRAAVSYPDGPERFDDAAVRAALERVDLGHLVPLLDRTERWDHQLSLDEQQRLAFARLLLQRPRWVVLDDAVGALDEEHRRLVLSIFERELAGATVIHFGRGPVVGCSWDRTLHIIEQPGGPCFHAGLPPATRTVAAAPTGTEPSAAGAGSPAALSRRTRCRREGNERDERYAAGGGRGRGSPGWPLPAARACCLRLRAPARSQRRSPARSRAEADLPVLLGFRAPDQRAGSGTQQSGVRLRPRGRHDRRLRVRHHDHHRGNRAPLAQQARGARSPAADGPLPLHGRTAITAFFRIF